MELKLARENDVEVMAIILRIKKKGTRWFDFSLLFVFSHFFCIKIFKKNVEKFRIYSIGLE